MSPSSRPACVDTGLELWFGPNEDQSEETFYERQQRERRAKEMCLSCATRVDCLVDELARPVVDQYGVRGGMTASERRRLLAKWRKAEQIPAYRAVTDRAVVAGLLDAEPESA